MKSSTCLLSTAAAATFVLLTTAIADELRQPQRGAASEALAALHGHEAASRHAALVRTGESRFDWNWLAERFDRDRDGTVSKKELPPGMGHFDRLDCTWDSVLRADDFDWSGGNDLCRQKETAFALFKSVDANSDGRLSA